MAGFGSDDKGGRGAGRTFGPGPGGGWPGGGSGAARPPGLPGVADNGVRPGAEPRAGAAQPPGGGPGGPAARPSAAQGPTPVEVPTPTMPKGGGAIRPIAEKFSANPATGTGSMSVPIAASPGRSGFGPSLSLSYDSGAGNGPFGLGWSLAVPSVSHKTERGLPQYRDDRDSDTFILSGAEDLVPALREDGETWVRDVVPLTPGSFPRRERYRPRVEAAFARIERVTEADGNVYWQATTKDNVTSVYGKSPEARITDPAYPDSHQRVFRWLLEETHDDRGNVVRYVYKAEDRDGVAPAIHEKGRLEQRALFSNLYLKRVLYGNVPNPQAPSDFHFELVFDYGEHDQDAPTPDDGPHWPCRLDPFSSYRAGFEIRTYRLCRRVLMFHRFPDELGEDPVLVRSTDFEYDEGAAFTYLTRVSHKGYVRPTPEAAYSVDSLPWVDLDYSRATLQSTVRDLDRQSLAQVPYGVDGRAYQWVDLDGEGIPGVLTDQGGALYYKRNLGQGKLAPACALRTKPSVARLGRSAALTRDAGVQQLLDVTGDGLPDLVCLGGPMGGGFHHRTHVDDWRPFRAFSTLPNVDWSDPSLRFIDLDGDGFADVMLSEDHVYTWYPSLRENGYGAPRRASRYSDEDKGPTLVFAEAEQTVFLADMSGDGLQDLVRIRNGSVCYWPNLGYGKFGPMVTMGGAPCFAPSNLYDPKRVRLADVDGSGTADLIYVGTDGVHVWMNQAGNGFGDRTQLAVFPSHDSLSTVDVVDLLGTGTSCLVWSTPLRGYPPQMRYVDLLGSTKPHLLISVKNGIGLETRIGYAPSTKFYLEDRATGRKWATRLPFPVQVVERIEHYDHVAKHKFVSTYRYRHGYYDSEEREFRGFGYVETRDAETVGANLGQGLFPPDDYEVENDLDHDNEPMLRLPPVVTKSWFHTGAWKREASLIAAFEAEWFTPDPAEPRLVMPALPAPAAGSSTAPTLTPPEWHQAHRALAGKLLRQEVYAEDESPDAGIPYAVTQQTWSVRRVQPTGELTESVRNLNLHPAAPYAVFHAFAAETLTLQYERLDAEPRVSHDMALEVDDLGYVLTSAKIGYGRIDPPTGLEAQGKLWVSMTEQSFLRELDLDGSVGWYRHGVAHESMSWEMGPALTPTGSLLTVQQVADAFGAFTEIAYDSPLPAAPLDPDAYKRQLSHTRAYYWLDGLSGPALFDDPLPRRALPHETYALALTPSMLSVNGPLANKVGSTVVTTEGGYVDLNTDGRYWARSGIAHYDAAAFYLTSSVTDAFGNNTAVDYDSYKLFATETTDPLGNVVSADIDYRVLAPKKVTDPNQNFVEAAFDALGRVTATAVQGKNDEGDSLLDWNTPTSRFTYELGRYAELGKPVRVKTERRETHGDPDPPTRWLVSYTYADGTGAELMTKVLVEHGVAPVLDENGHPVKEGQPEHLVFDDATPRYVGTGRTVRDNKGNPVKQYEPYFSATEEYESDPDIVEWGVTPVLHYDPLSRLIATDFPDGSNSKVEFTPWQQSAWDQNDTLTTTTPWAVAHAGQPERAKALAHAGTPTVTHFDSLGRAFKVVEHNKVGSPPTDAYYATTSDLDVQGNVLSVSDAKDRPCMTYAYGVLGQILKQTSIDAGTRWTFATAAGEPVRSWGERGFTLDTTYDALRRPTHLRLTEDGSPSTETVVERLVYGEAYASPPDYVRTRLVQHYDQSGVLLTGSYDFEGNLLAQTKRLAASYDELIDWSVLDAYTTPSDILEHADDDLEDETFSHSATYDALGRPTSVTAPDNSVVSSTYNLAGLLKSVACALRGATPASDIVESITYDEKGRRTSIVYGNGAETTYAYDPLTFRLANFDTIRGSTTHLQRLAYTYDPVGNIVAMTDTATQVDVYFSVAPAFNGDTTYTYDPIYRLVEATGREHPGTTDGQLDELDVEPPWSIPHPNDSNGMRGYTQTYAYDNVGNIAQMAHRTSTQQGQWTRTYNYPTPAASNRLASTTNGQDTRLYAYDAHGNMTMMPHLSAIDWDYADQMRHVDKGGGGQVYFVYDGAGERVRKVWIHSNLKEERIYLGGYEIYRRSVIDPEPQLLDERQTLHIADDSRRVCMSETLTWLGGEEVATPTPRLRYQLDNHLGTACVETDQDGLVISYEEYHPFGTSAYRAFQSQEVSAKRYRYIGKERDDETGLYAMGARYYAPWLGRWTACDPLWGVDGVCLYQYCRGSPIISRDPNGTYDPDYPYEAPQLRQAEPAQDAPREQEKGKNVPQIQKKRGTAPSVPARGSGHPDVDLPGLGLERHPGTYQPPQECSAPPGGCPPGSTYVSPGPTDRPPTGWDDPLYRFLVYEHPTLGQVLWNATLAASVVVAGYSIESMIRSGPQLRSAPTVAPGEAEAAAPEVVPEAEATAGRLRPLGGTVNVGGGGGPREPQGVTNLNAGIPGTGGPPLEKIPDLVRGDAAEIGELFEEGSIERIISHRLTPDTVNWPRFASGAYTAMKPGGTVDLNITVTQGQFDPQTARAAFEQAGFKNVVIQGSGWGTRILAVR